MFWDERDRLTGLFVCNRPAKGGRRLCKQLVKTDQGCHWHRHPQESP
jgi:hypothetical protein